MPDLFILIYLLVCIFFAQSYLAAGAGIDTDAYKEWISLRNDGDKAFREKRYSDSLAFYKRALELAMEMPKSKSCIYESLRDIADYHVRQKNDVEAAVFLRRAIKQKCRSDGEDSVELEDPLLKLAQIQLRQNKAPDAELALRRAMQIALRGSDDPLLPEISKQLIANYALQDKENECAAIFRKLAKTRFLNRNSDKIDGAPVLLAKDEFYRFLAHATNEYQQGRQANPFMLEELSLLKNCPPSPRLVHVLHYLSNNAFIKNHLKQAEAFSTQELTLRKQLNLMSDTDYINNLAILAGVKLNQKLPADAELLLKKAISNEEEKLNANQPLLRSLKITLVAALQSQGKAAEAQQINKQLSADNKN